MLPNALGNEYLILWDLLQKLVTSNSLEESLHQIGQANQVLSEHNYEAILFSKNEILRSEEKFQLTRIINYILTRVHIIRSSANINSADNTNHHFERNGMLQDFEYIILRIGSSGQSPTTKLQDDDFKDFLSTYFVNDVSKMMMKYPNQCRAILYTLNKLGLSISNQDYDFIGESSDTNTFAQLFSVYKELLNEKYISSLQRSLMVRATSW